VRFLAACLVIVILASSSSPALAEIAVMENGKILYVDKFERVDDFVKLYITGGGEVTVPWELVSNIVPNEVVRRTEDPREVTLLPHLKPIIEPAAERYGLDPNLVAAVIWAESSGDPNAVSRKGARGLMQLMPQTARELGVRRIHDPSENVHGGTRYLRKMLDEHAGDLTLALAAYNAGPTAVRRHGGVPPYAETRAYVGRVLDMYEQAREGGP
jgi:hypothetical protein